MTENEQFTGRLGLECRDSGTLAVSVSAVVDTLEEFGHPAEKIEARAENTARLLCDHYLVTVRLRRVPLRRASRLPGSIMQPEALLEIALEPLYPGHCDQEITELLLAEVLRQLLPVVEATSVEWLETAITLSCEQFLSAFEADQHDPPVVEPKLKPAAVPARPRGRACFTPVEQTAIALDAHYDRAFQAAPIRQTSRNTVAAVKRVRARMSNTPSGSTTRWLSGNGLLENVVSALNLTGARRIRLISNMLLISALLLFLDSADMVQAARSSLP